MTLKKLIMTISAAYPENMVARYYNRPKRDFGDGLAEFIAREIRETYNRKASTLDQVRCAQRKLLTAKHEISSCIGALEAYITSNPEEAL